MGHLILFSVVFVAVAGRFASGQDATNSPTDARATLYPQLFRSGNHGSDPTGSQDLPFPGDTNQGTSDPPFSDGTPDRSATGSPNVPLSSSQPVVSTGVPDTAASQDKRTDQAVNWPTNTARVLTSDFIKKQKTTPSNGATQTAERSAEPSGSSLGVKVTTEKVGQTNHEVMPTETVLEWLNAIHRSSSDAANNNQGQVPTTHDKHIKHNSRYRGNPFDPDVLPPEKFLKWLSGNEPVENYIEVKQQSVTVPNDSASNNSLIIVIVAVCGTVSLCVTGIIVAICYRSRTKSDKEDSLSHETPVRFQVASKQEAFTTPTEYPNIFMGIPANNEIWKDLQNLPESTTVIIPENIKA